MTIPVQTWEHLVVSTDDTSHRREKLERYPSGQDGEDIALPDRARALYERFLKEHEVDDLNEAIDLCHAARKLRRFGNNDRSSLIHNLHRAALELRPSGHPLRSLSLHGIALCLSNRYDNQGLVADLEAAIMLGRAALERCPSGHPNRGVTFYNLACDLRKRFVKQAGICDLDEAIKLHRGALELLPSGHPLRSLLLHGLALCLSNRYDKLGVVDDLEEAITLGRAALELCPPGHPDRGVSLYNLACDLRMRFMKQAVMRDLEEAIDLLRAALELHPTGHPLWSLSLRALALCLSKRYDHQGLDAGLEEAIMLRRAALELCPPGHPDRGISLHNLACDLRTRFTKQAVTRDLDEAIELHHAALELHPPGDPLRSLSLRELALCLSNRYDKLGVFDDLEEAITLGRAALELCPPGHPGRSVSLHNLACVLRRKFIKQAVMRDLEEAIELHRAAFELRPAGHPDQSSTFHELALCLSHRHDKQALADDLEEAIALGRAALELCPPGHPNRSAVLCNLACDVWKKFQQHADIPGLHTTNSLHQAVLVVRPTSKADLASSLFEFSVHLWDRFQKQSMMTDLDDAICLATYALELRLPHEVVSVGAWVQRLAQGANSHKPVMFDRAADNLCDLAKYHRARFHTQHTIVDLNEAITLYRYMLQLRPTGHPRHASSLHDLAQCLADRFHQQPEAASLDEAIALEQKALQLLVRGDPDYDVSRCCLAAYLQTKISSQLTMMSPDAPGVTHLDVKQVIRNVAFETLKTVPTRLLYTPTGVLCNRGAQVSHFMRSQQYKLLESLCTTCGGDQQMELIHTCVSRHFQYVTFSHRWGEDEPSLRDIESRAIYNMPVKGGYGKLQAFCAVACERDYLWAWSDTCCIDKDSSAEVQETVGSMFAWYRQSALTIVYLSDVPDTGSLGDSEWFRRGWTLQELLAPKRILFYTQNWSLYKNLTSSNHKADDVVLEGLTRATGIESQFLSDFSPGMDDARSRLQWASLRRTTRAEDIAYSLFGIFNLHLPVLYGESAENALGRLLANIISQSADISVLDWVGEASLFHSCFPAHITSYHTLPSPRPKPYPEEQSQATSHWPSSFTELINFCGSLATMLLPQFLSRSMTPSSVARTPDSYAPSGVYDFRSLTRAPLPRFLDRCLILPCIAHRVTAVQLTRADPSAPSYIYKLQASGLRPLEIALPDKLENATRLHLHGALHLVRPWHSNLLGPSAELDAITEEQLLITLERPFNALLLSQLPHNEHKRIASSTLIIAQPVDRASIRNSKARIFNIV